MGDLKPIYVSIPEAMRLLSIGRTKVYDLVNCGSLSRVHVGAKSLICVQSIERFAASLRDA
ncbi:helix-turn-helix domain-containing protein [Sphingomonas sp. LY160]|uniref:helix-turn-helix domain-containing protein n=1 Tax=Sphingomonas sp. LY160 TaxID=3095342 RepID=UPI002ADEB4B7|nr:helix-turn-helix domain-containing protein [Sphingomonas sp. LY160]MEA1071085.1 helix-turn-helix domain-containing protein [Sphingomonas sp. LY160]